MSMHLEKSRKARRSSGLAFTLIELLVVISIIALLVGILLPSIGMAIKQASDARTSARIAELSGGCNMYRTENGFYPGQQYADQLGSNSSGKFTGSQWLAKSLFSDPDATPTYPHPKYAPLKADSDLIDPKHSGIGAISDRNKAADKVMPILYYPARVGVSGLGQYQSADNADHVSGNTGPGSKSFNDFIRDERFGSTTTPYNPGAFLLIAAGRDRLYFTDDDICYPAFGSE